MLIVLVHNDGSGPDHDANYDVEVRVNQKTLWRGRVDGHNRSEGWPELLQRIAHLGMAAGQRPHRDLIR